MRSLWHRLDISGTRSPYHCFPRLGLITERPGQLPHSTKTPSPEGLDLAVAIPPRCGGTEPPVPAWKWMPDLTARGGAETAGDDLPSPLPVLSFI